MAALLDAERFAIWKKAMSDAGFGPIETTKAELRTAVNETDSWIDDNATAYNNALSEPFKSTATAGQKALLFAYVALERYGVI